MGAPLPPSSVDTQRSATQAAKRRVIVASEDSADAEWLQMRMGAALQVSHCESTLDAVLACTSQEAAAVVVVFDARADLSQPAQIVQWLVKYRPDMPVLGMGYANSAKVPLAALRAGVKDFLDISAANIEEVRKPVWEACMRGSHNPKGTAKGKVVSIIGARSGMGVTTLAVHLSAAIASLSDAGASKKQAAYEADAADLGVGLLDLGFPLCDGQMLLGLSTSFHMVDAVQGINRLDQAMLDSALPPHTCGVRALSWPAQTHVLREVSPLSTSAVLQRMREFFAWQVVDVGGFPSQDIIQEVIRHSDHVWMVCDQSVGGIVSLSELLKSLKAAQGSHLSIDGLIVNRSFKGVGLPAADIAKRFNLPLIHVLPNREEVLLKSSSAGLLLSESAPSDPYFQGVRYLAQSLMQASTQGTRIDAVGIQSLSQSWFKRMFRIGRSA